MPIPNVSTLYSQIANGSEGGHEFARFIKLLLTADYTARGIEFIAESDASGDYRKLDAYLPGDEEFKEMITGFQWSVLFCAPCSAQTREETCANAAAIEPESGTKTPWCRFTRPG